MRTSEFAAPEHKSSLEFHSFELQQRIIILKNKVLELYTKEVFESDEIDKIYRDIYLLQSMFNSYKNLISYYDNNLIYKLL